MLKNTFQALRTQGRSHERGRRHKTAGIFIVRCPRGRRPARYAGYECVFEAEPYAFMEWLKEHQDGFGLKFDKPKPVRTVAIAEGIATTSENRVATEAPAPKRRFKNLAWWTAAAVALGGLGAGLYHYLG